MTFLCLHISQIIFSTTFDINFCVLFGGGKEEQLFIKLSLTNDDDLINYYYAKCQTVIHINF